MDELFYGVGAISGGFSFADAMLGELATTSATIERKADLLEAAVRRTFEVDPPPGALEVIAPRVIAILNSGLEACLAVLRSASEGRSA
jgi:hypothetical protein